MEKSWENVNKVELKVWVKAHIWGNKKSLL